MNLSPIPSLGSAFLARRLNNRIDTFLLPAKPRTILFCLAVYLQRLTRKNIVAPMFFALVWAFSLLSLHAQQSGVFEALYIYKFAGYLRFPASADSFVIGVIGNSDIGAQLEKNVHGKKVGAAVVAVKKYTNPAEIEDCAMVFVPENQKSKLPQVLTRFKGKPTVVITQGIGVCSQGSIISLTLDQAKKFEINRAAIETTGVKVGAEIMQVAMPCSAPSP
jgi:hypothetical protein